MTKAASAAASVTAASVAAASVTAEITAVGETSRTAGRSRNGRGTSGRQSYRRRGLALSALVLVTGFLLSACVGIPSSGPVERGEPLTTNDELDVVFQPSKPVDGASQEDILLGFIQAALNPREDYEIAREYLSADFQHRWNPDSGVTIDQGTRHPDVINDNEMSLKITPVAEVSNVGAYSQTISTSPLPLPFSFVKEQGQWRISKAPNGIVMSASEFNEVFKSYALYFFDPSYRFLVPDLRWFPRVTSTTGTRIVRALINGPAPWLATGAVINAFPEGTGVTSVPINNGQARVDLTGPVLDETPAGLQRMQAQLKASLGAINGVSSVQLTVDLNEVAVPSPESDAAVVNPRVDNRALVLEGGQFGFSSGSSVTPIDGISTTVADASPTAVSYLGKPAMAAMSTAAGAFVVEPGAAAGPIDTRAGLIAPTIDPIGFVWTMPGNAPQSIQVSKSGRLPTTLQTNWDGASTIVSLDVSRDGTRLLAFVNSGGVPRLLVSSIVRDKDGVPTDIGAPLTLSSGSGVPIDATWVDQLTVASVTVLPNGENTIIQQVIGGQSTALADATGVTAIVGSNDPAGLRLLTSSGQIEQPRGNAWQVISTGVSILATQG
jgi:hypothetical protein